MLVFNHTEKIIAHLDLIRTKELSTGFVPTMGALHEGHLSLIRKCIAENDACVVSIFVNPTQFNDPKDYLRYPRIEKEDTDMLSQIFRPGDMVFIPSNKEIYPDNEKETFSLGILDQVMEGKHRPGHFNGVAQIVKKLFEIVAPHNAYFGEKDFQQLAVIRKITADFHLPVCIIPFPTVREHDGLAMSSRNRLLTPEQRENAPLIFQALCRAVDMKKNNVSPSDTMKQVISLLNNNPFFQVEYFEIIDGNSFLPIHNWNDSSGIVGCIAVKMGEIRLIDNIKF